MSAVHPEGSELLAPNRGLLARWRQRRAQRRSRRDFDAVFRAWSQGAPLPRRLRRS